MICLLYTSRAFRRVIPDSKVLFEDNFNKQSRNIDYIDNQDEFFSDSHLYYQNENYVGFADYSCLLYTSRNEYYYKNTLLNKLLLGIHSVNTTTALTEIPIAKSKADFVLINGKAVVYEIKTELDNFDRLENQINDYYTAFDHVAVVTCKENIQVLKDVYKRQVDSSNK